MIDIRTIATSGLGDRSYLATDGEVAVVIDPQRDIDRVLDLAADLGVAVTHVAETHIHNDYVTGGLDLAQRTGAAYLVNAADEVGFDRTPIADGEQVTTGTMGLRAIATPGHTHHHLSYALLDTTADTGGEVLAVFTGGSMLYGTTGRTDLVSPEDTVALTHAQFHSVRRLVAELPAEAAVYPTHGFGSFCASTPASGADGSTVGQEATTNPALTQDEQDYVDTLIAGLGAFPTYYARMSPANTAGPAPVDLSAPEPVDPAELRRRLEAGQWVVDLRERTAFAAGHLPGSLGYELATPFVTYFGWTFEFDAELTLIGDDPQQVADAQRELVRIGIDRFAGAATGPIESLDAGQGLRSYPVSDFTGLAAARAERGQDALFVVDARRDEERAAGGVQGSVHIPLHELPGRRDEVPDGQVWVYCGSGYRASIAASMLDRPGRDLVLINDDWPRAAAAGLPITDQSTTGN
ncbi:MBL fold metallo-hydrolase [Pseudonocardia parietis]|uniref:Glyoxylase-like metal-dependent hydrolase (Beta-lactamase superfamily II)/rhodanese-related sulfurtransferase n=1 Tax=Pseudonocardia parietis TaxID=570936 RepID=A0ABS4W7A3_9PSEU|nr:MBL fold metallo-hydrolase [Pseudonocardia parietis]MBP2372003.1 glyoxylase-like metal-dependent hydrolase (beta-lactamase superfamily II)/rhodanese-related sulfurtransferase [Pseudonocardia parietis]